MSFDITGKTILVTGANRGIGKAIVETFLEHGAGKIIAAVRSPDTAQPLVDAHGDKIDVIRAVKSVTTPIFQHPIRLGRCPDTGAMIVHEDQPEIYSVLPAKE